jgi:hypothetical protein
MSGLKKGDVVLKIRLRWESSLMVILCALSLVGCPAQVPSISNPGAQTNLQPTAQKQCGNLSLTINWPNRQLAGFNTQVIPTTTNALVVWVRDGSTLLDQKTIVRATGTASASVNFSLKAGNNYSVEAKAYRESSPSDTSTAIARGTANVNILLAQTTNT